jgi:hypothetical protein
LSVLGLGAGAEYDAALLPLFEYRKTRGNDLGRIRMLQLGGYLFKHVTP